LNIETLLSVRRTQQLSWEKDMYVFVHEEAVSVARGLRGFGQVKCYTALG
jgi:hypothetical protein